jgi:hypothetical protein
MPNSKFQQKFQYVTPPFLFSFTHYMFWPLQAIFRWGIQLDVFSEYLMMNKDQKFSNPESNTSLLETFSILNNSVCSEHLWGYIMPWVGQLMDCKSVFNEISCMMILVPHLVISLQLITCHCVTLQPLETSKDMLGCNIQLCNISCALLTCGKPTLKGTIALDGTWSVQTKEGGIPLHKSSWEISLLTFTHRTFKVVVARAGQSLFKCPAAVLCLNVSSSESA